MFTRTFARNCSVLAASVAAIAVGSGCSTTSKHSSLPQTHMLAGYDDFDTPGKRAPNAKTLYRLGKLLESQGQIAQAEAVWMSCIDRYPAFSPAYTELASIQMATNRDAKAVNTLEAGLAKQPNDHVLLNNLGMCFMMNKQFSGAFEAFSKARDLDPNNSKYTANAALALGMLGRTDEALALYQTIMPMQRAQQNLNVISQAMGVELQAATPTPTPVTGTQASSASSRQTTSEPTTSEEWTSSTANSQPAATPTTSSAASSWENTSLEAPVKSSTFSPTSMPTKSAKASKKDSSKTTQTAGATGKDQPN